MDYNEQEDYQDDEEGLGSENEKPVSVIHCIIYKEEEKAPKANLTTSGKAILELRKKQKTANKADSEEELSSGMSGSEESEEVAFRRNCRTIPTPCQKKRMSRSLLRKSDRTNQRAKNNQHLYCFIL
eukprot:TRINITY_DN1972_c0_g1_i13.p2 TRINITY_DN1972_c0_g1~~TRINITY_DN1972_c0_g1_i13.p2  ORF type:complete len:127 (-),score=20.74 TRINITY_DN1972_c0_g1_i13:113-493(-)